MIQSLKQGKRISLFFIPEFKRVKGLPIVADPSRPYMKLNAEELKDFVEQFDFKMRAIEDKGFVSYTKPGGTQQVKNIYFEMTIDDVVVAFYAYLLGSLAEYDGLKPFMMKFQSIQAPFLEEEPPSEDDIDESLQQFRETILAMKEELEQYYINDKLIFLDAAPYLSKKGNTMVPIRAICDMIDIEPQWNGAAREVTLEYNGISVLLQIDNDIACINGEQVKMPEAAVIRNQRTFVPLRFVSENLGAYVEWDGKTRSVYIEF